MGVMFVRHGCYETMNNINIIVHMSHGYSNVHEYVDGAGPMNMSGDLPNKKS